MNGHRVLIAFLVFFLHLSPQLKRSFNQLRTVGGEGTKQKKLALIISLILVSCLSQTNITLAYNGNSDCHWAGHVVVCGNKALVTSVSASFTVPEIADVNQLSVFGMWVGIGGYNTNGIAQIGIAAETYPDGHVFRYSWYQMYPQPAVMISAGFDAGINFTAKVEYLGNDMFNLSLNNFSIVQENRNLKCNSAEWIIEDPTGNTIWNFTNFGTATFANCQYVLLGSAQNTTVEVTESKTVKTLTSPLTNSAFAVRWLQP